MKKIFLLLLLFLSVENISAQTTNIDSLKKQLSIVQKDSDKYATLNDLCIYYDNYKPDSCIFFAKEMIELGIKRNMQRPVSDGYGWMGYQEFILGNYPLSLQHLHKSLELAENANDSILIANTHNAIGNAYKEYESYPKAITHYLKCKQVAEAINDSLDLLYANMNLGFVYAFMNKLDSSIYYQQQAYQLQFRLQLKNAPGFTSYTQESAVNRGLGLIQMKLGNKDLALSYLNMANQFDLKRGRTRYLCQTQYVLAEFYFKYNMIDSAIYYGKECLITAKAIPYPRGILKSTKFLSSLYESKNNIDSAFYYQKIFVVYNDSLNDKDKAASIENLGFEEQLRQKEKELAIREVENQRKQNIQFALIALGIVSFIIILSLLSRSFITNTKVIEFLGVIALLIVFEFLNLLLHPFLERVTHHSPVLMLLALVVIAALLVPLHHRIEKWTIKFMVEKNRKTRLEAAKKTIEKLDRKD